MHLPSNEVYQQMLSDPCLVRFVLGDNGKELEPTLIIKNSSLRLKYILQNVKIRITFFGIGGAYLCYALEVNDSSPPANYWSILRTDEEITALGKLASSKKCLVFLYNEACVNIAWNELEIEISPEVSKLIEQTSLYKEDQDHLIEEVSGILDNPGAYKGMEIKPLGEWEHIKSSYITNSIDICKIDFLDPDEGFQQEQLAIFLLDHLLPKGAVPSPQIILNGITRELTDVLLTHEYGAIIIESKVLSILHGSNIPDRARLAKTSAKNLRKALSQLKGACKKIKDGTSIYNKKMQQIEVERENPIHAICLIPDLSLIADMPEFGKQAVLKFLKDTGHFLHILDTQQLFRIMQAAGIISKASSRSTHIMAFDYYLIERLKKAATLDSAYFDMILKVQN